MLLLHSEALDPVFESRQGEEECIFPASVLTDLEGDVSSLKSQRFALLRLFSTQLFQRCRESELFLAQHFGGRHTCAYVVGPIAASIHRAIRRRLQS